MRTLSIPINAKQETRLDVFLLADSKEMADQSPRPLILVLPGGGYDFTSDREAEPIAMQFLAAGYHAAVLRYAVAAFKDFETALADGEFAFSQIHEHAAEWSVDVNRIGLIGFSAGGHLAVAMTVLTKARPAALLLGYPVTLPSFAAFMDITAPNLIQAVKPGLPPTFIFTTYEDNLVPVENTLIFAKALEEAEVPLELHLFQKGQHGLALGTQITANGQAKAIEPAFAQWVNLAKDWLVHRFAEIGQTPITPKLTPEETPVRDLMADSTLRAAILHAAPELSDEHAYKIVRNMPIKEIILRRPDLAKDPSMAKFLTQEA
ncbi:alpha/beta hydrolase [Lacticaseibacillus brantae]|uniref:Xylan esterase n=1 Tax=Lacticaseibacillus brantae DSM 23927 TaxID=1423727 RepID=A0A0R2B1V6_9LACO|nr:alpha/beta hydrolase [Lacticaseibacillus brantae]KRM73050.1 xylan esterase [Lacticaseibacillus brantae DSM 23927]